MATTPPAAAPKPKKKAVPTWYYIAGAVGLVAVYYLYSKSKASSAASTTAAAPVAGSGSSAGTAAGSYGNAGDLAALAPYLQPTSSGSGAVSTGLPNQSATGTVTDSAGNTYLPVPGGDYASLSAAGDADRAYYSPSPGIYLPITYQVASQGLASNYPLFLLTGNANGPSATPTPQGTVG